MLVALATIPALLPPAEAVTYYRSSTSAPTVSYTNLVDGIELSGTYKVVVKATDNKGVTYVNLFIDGIFFKKDSSKPYEFNIDTNKYTNGKHTIRAVAYDAQNNFARAIIVVYFKNTAPDTTAPTITAPGDISTEATAMSTPVNLGSPTVNDLVDSTPTITNNAPSQGFPVGVSTVIWSATDDSGNSATDTQTVTITDTKSPAITAPPSITQEATGPLTSINLGTPTATDIADPDLSITNDSPAEGFPIGTATVTWTVTDDSGNSATATQAVTITDTIAPSITAPAAITFEATDQLTSVPLGDPISSDIVDPTLSIENDAPSGGFPVGATTVTWTATDDSDNTAIDTQLVTIKDTTAPSINAPSDITQDATGPLTFVSIGSATAIDMVDPFPTITNDAPSEGFPIGTTMITWTAVDASGNSATSTQIVIITDGTDSTVPEVRIISPVEDEVLPRTQITVTGDASDLSGVANVEVSLQSPDSSAGTDFVITDTTDGYSHWSVTVPVVDTEYTKIVARAIDESGNVGLHNVNISYEQEEEPIPPPPPPPPPSNQDKILLATIIPWINLQTQMDIYEELMNDNDMAKVRADSAGVLKADQVDAVLTLLGTQGAEFMAASHIEQKAEYLESIGFEFIVYNLEAGISPEEDKADPIAAVNRAAAAAHSAGLDFHIAPTKVYTLSHGVEFAKVAEVYHIQGQAVQAQDTPVGFSNYVHETVSKMKAVNSDIITTVQVSTTREAGAGLTLLETMQACIDSVMDVSDGATTWFANDSVNTAREFYQWFSSNYNG